MSFKQGLWLVIESASVFMAIVVFIVGMDWVANDEPYTGGIYAPLMALCAALLLLLNSVDVDASKRWTHPNGRKRFAARSPLYSVESVPISGSQTRSETTHRSRCVARIQPSVVLGVRLRCFGDIDDRCDPSKQGRMIAGCQSAARVFGYNARKSSKRITIRV